MSRIDILTIQALANGNLHVDPETGDIYNRQGERAEYLDKRLAYGRVQVYHRPYTLAMAHRVVWIAIHGPIPRGLQINHINRCRWDNRPENLELVSPAGNARHWRGSTYDAISPAANVKPEWLDHFSPSTQAEQANPYTHSPEALVIDHAA